MEYQTKLKETIKTVESTENGLRVTGSFSISADGIITNADIKVEKIAQEEGQPIFPGVLSMSSNAVNMSVPQSESSMMMSELLIKTFAAMQQEAQSVTDI